MPITEGSANAPQDAGSRYLDGIYNPSNGFLYLFRDDGNHSLRVALYDSTGAVLFGAASAALADAESNAGAVPRIGSRLEGYNGTTWDRLRVDAAKNLLVSLNTLLSGENQTDNRLMVENAWTGFSITTQTTTTVKSGAGKLGYLLIPTPVANATIKAYDNTAASGTLIFDTITFPAALVSDGPIMLAFGGHTFTTGLTIVTAGATMSVSGGYL